MKLLSMIGAIGGFSHGILLLRTVSDHRMRDGDGYYFLIPGLVVLALVFALAVMGKLRREQGQPFWVSYWMSVSVLLGYLIGAFIPIVAELTI